MKTINFKYLDLFFSVLIGAFTSYSYVCASDGPLDKDQTKSTFHSSIPTMLKPEQEIAQKILQEGYLVHVAPLNPFENDLILQAGSAVPIYMQMPRLNVKKLVEYKPNQNSFRPCLSFSINGIIGDHGEINVSDRTYAVLIPLRNLAERIINLYPADTAVWGNVDLKEQEGCIVFAPKKQLTEDLKKLKTGPHKVEVQAYSGKLADTVEAFLKKTTGFAVKFQDAPKGLEIFYDKALAKGVNLNVLNLFDSFLATRPYVAFGHESGSLKSGLTHWLRFLNKFNDDFLRIYKQGMYKEHPAADLDLIRKYQVESLIVLAEHSIIAVQDLLTASKKEEILEDFKARHLPKLNLALTNVRNYHACNKEKKVYQNRVINFSDTIVVLGNSPYTWVNKVLSHPSFQEVQKVFEVVYWFNRYISHHCHGHVKVDENDELTMLQKSSALLKESFSADGYNWSYVRFCYTIVGGLQGIPQTETNKEHIEKAMTLVMPLLPQSGSLDLKGPNKETSKMDLKQFLDQNKIKLPEILWKQGISKEFPIFQSINSIQQSF
ncbi:MAG: hypothetical protein BGO77_00235 [Caedibacter sp. 37-49]|nr:MAG: hypothetical protein BGO77_00235 [Caedibacter sp. 37-49]